LREGISKELVASGGPPRGEKWQKREEEDKKTIGRYTKNSIATEERGGSRLKLEGVPKCL